LCAASYVSGLRNAGHGIIKVRKRLEPALFNGRRGGCAIAVSACETVFGRMSEAGGNITVTVKCKHFPGGEEIVELPGNSTVLQLKERYHEKYGFDIKNLHVINSEGARVLNDDQVWSTISSVSKSLTVSLMISHTCFA